MIFLTWIKIYMNIWLLCLSFNRLHPLKGYLCIFFVKTIDFVPWMNYLSRLFHWGTAFLRISYVWSSARRERLYSRKKLLWFSLSELHPLLGCLYSDFAEIRKFVFLKLINFLFARWTTPFNELLTSNLCQDNLE